MIIRYGGIEVHTLPQEALDTIESELVFEDVCPFLPNNWNGEAEGKAWNLFCEPRHRTVRVNRLYWPTGASRWALSHLLVTETALNAIRNLAYDTKVSGQYKSLPLEVYSNGFRDFTTQMYTLPSFPIYQVKETAYRQLYIMPIVDERFLWYEKSGTLTITENTTTWAQLISAIATLLGITITTDTISADYLKPPASLAQQYTLLPLLLDVVCLSIGHKLIRKLDGTVITQTATTAKTIHDRQLEMYVKLIGGLMSFQS